MFIQLELTGDDVKALPVYTIWAAGRQSGLIYSRDVRTDTDHPDSGGDAPGGEALSPDIFWGRHAELQVNTFKAERLDIPDIDLFRDL